MKSELEQKFVIQLKENQRIIHKICRIYGNDTNEHQDLFQEIVIQLWKSYPNFRGDAKFSTWAYRIGLNTAMALFKKKKRIEFTSVEIETLQHIDLQDWVIEEEKLKKMYNAIHILNDVEKALIMMYLDDKDYEEISAILGISEGNARVKMNRAKNKLKSIINKS